MICDMVYRASSSHTYTSKLRLISSYTTLLVARLACGIPVARIVIGMLLLDALSSSFVHRLNSPRLAWSILVSGIVNGTLNLDAL